MKCLILAGGSGNTIWPLSRKNFPKQFMHIKDNRSLLQETVARNMAFCDEFIVSTLLEYRNTLDTQMEVFQGLHYHNMYEGLSRKTTAALVMTSIMSAPEEILFVVASDQFIEGDGYKEAVYEARELVEEGHIVLFGVEPTVANTNYGYMQTYQDRVLRFYERPSASLAAAFCELEDFLCNCSLCMFRVKDFLEQFKELQPEIYEACESAVKKGNKENEDLIFSAECMQDIPSISSGKAFFSKAKDLRVVKGNFLWQDIGKLEDLTRFQLDEGEKIIRSCENTNVINTVPNTLVVANGVDDLIIVNTKDAVLITRKNNQTEMKELLQEREEGLASYFEETLPEKKVVAKKTEMVKLVPHLEERLWGGNRLEKEFGKITKMDNIAESWELSAHPAGQSVIGSGRWEGMQFQDYLIKIGKEAWGWKCDHLDRFPILVKFIDARETLSVQVHPDDDFALFNEKEYGKNEMWYICDCEPDSFLYYGLRENLTEKEVRKRIEEHTIVEALNKVPVKKGDAIFVKAGTIHAIGKGILICEIQQSSNITYRLYDFDRKDKNGEKRELHIEKALMAADLTPCGQQFQDFERLDKDHEFSEQIIGQCKYFECKKYIVWSKMKLTMDDSSFLTITVIDGNGIMKDQKNEMSVQKGETVFIPAGQQEIEVVGNCTIIVTHI